MLKKSALLAIVSLFLCGFAAAPSAAAGFSKARFHGKPSGCPRGSFFDPRHFGECWSCPSGMKRTIFPVTGRSACERPAYSNWSRSKKHRKNSRVGQGCPKGQFWDIKGGRFALGACYSCPSGYRRTIFPVGSGKACERVHHARRTRARYVSKFGCPNGTFLDLRHGGECWSCPSGWHRTVNPVTGSRACARRFVDIFAADNGAICKQVIRAIKAGASGAQKLKHDLNKFIAPVTKPINAVMNRVPRISSPRELDRLLDKVARAMAPYEPVARELSRVGGDALRHPGRLSNVLLNSRLICDGNPREINHALIAAGLNPNFRVRRAGLMDGLLVGTAHAATNYRVFHAVSVSNGGRSVNQPFGLELAFTLVTDFRDYLRVFFSFPGVLTSTVPAYDISVGYMIFPRARIDNFEQINQLGIEIGLGQGETVENFIKGKRFGGGFWKYWPGGLGFNVSFDPDFVRNPRANVPGFGVNWSWGEREGRPRVDRKLRLVDVTATVDWTFRLGK